MKFLLLITVTLLFTGSTIIGLESYLGYTQDNPPPSGYWYSDEPGCYNPRTDDIQMTLLEFPGVNEGVTNYKSIQIEPVQTACNGGKIPIFYVKPPAKLESPAFLLERLTKCKEK
ncbi:MAG: hypothetical protein ABFS16_04065 [Bacteroidota bacterium]